VNNQNTNSIAEHLLQSAACCRRFLEMGSLDRISRFVLSCQQSDGGFRGGGAQSNLYYTLFAVATLKAIDYPIPIFKVWKYLLSFGTGKGLDLVQLACLIRLRLAFPMLGTTRRRLFRRLEDFPEHAIHSLFFQLLAREEAASLGEVVSVSPDAPTLQLAAAVLVNQQKDLAIEKALLGRFVASGGFLPSSQADAPNLVSTASALFALVEMNSKLDGIQPPCFKYIESLWRSSGGFAGDVTDESEDVEYTFYAILAMGCLIQSLASSYGS